jgi:SAM-dependent methyltransferase
MMPRNHDPYAPCFCNSGMKCKFCHYLLEIAAAANRREVSQKLYIQRWIKSAQSFQAQGCYSWMASLLRPYSPKSILDVGCGDGSGLIALCNEFGDSCQVLSCDDSYPCLEAAAENISGKGVNHRVIKRLKQVDSGIDFHTMSANAGLLENIDDCSVTLIEADLLWDNEFKDYLCSSHKFEAITCWLIGTYDLKVQSTNIKVDDPGAYRLKVQNTMYRLADKLLKPGGVLQVVDRGEVPNDEMLREDNLNSHREQAEGTFLEVISHDFIEYDEPSGGILMQVTIPTSGRMPNLSQLAMTSIISIKR